MNPVIIPIVTQNGNTSMFDGIFQLRPPIKLIPTPTKDYPNAVAAFAMDTSGQPLHIGWVGEENGNVNWPINNGYSFAGGYQKEWEIVMVVNLHISPDGNYRWLETTPIDPSTLRLTPVEEKKEKGKSLAMKIKEAPLAHPTLKALVGGTIMVGRDAALLGLKGVVYVADRSGPAANKGKKSFGGFLTKIGNKLQS